MIAKSNNSNIYLRSINIGDAEDIARLANDSEIAFNIANIGSFPYPYGKADAMEFIEFVIEVERSGKELHFCIINIDKDAVVGVIGLMNIEHGFCAEIGYWIGKEYRRKGYCKAAVNTMLGVGFNKLNLYKIYAEVVLDNPNSLGVLESCKFKRDGVIRAGRYTTKYKNEFKIFMEMIKGKGNDINIKSVASEIGVDNTIIRSWFERFILKKKYGIDKTNGDVTKDPILLSILKSEYKGTIQIDK